MLGVKINSGLLVFLVLIGQAVDPVNPHDPIDLTHIQFFLWCAAVCAVGGATTALPKKLKDVHGWTNFLKVTIRSGIMGAAFSLMAFYWVAGNVLLTFLAMGIIFIMGLGGEGSILWARTQVRQWLTRNTPDREK